MRPVDEIRAHYNQSPEGEWNRIENRPEFLLSCRFMSRYIRKGDRILDIGGGPGRYALHFANEGCDVTLLDLADENVRFAKAKAAELGLPLKAFQGDARRAAGSVEQMAGCKRGSVRAGGIPELGGTLVVHRRKGGRPC